MDMEKKVDMQAAMDALELSEEEYYELVGDLEEFFNARIKDLEKCCLEKDYITLSRHAHSIKGAMRNLHFTAVAAVSQLIEDTPETPDHQTIMSHIRDLHQCFGESLRELGPQ